MKEFLKNNSSEIIRRIFEKCGRIKKSILDALRGVWSKEKEAEKTSWEFIVEGVDASDTNYTELFPFFVNSTDDAIGFAQLNYEDSGLAEVFIRDNDSEKNVSEIVEINSENAQAHFETESFTLDIEFSNIASEDGVVISYDAKISVRKKMKQES